MIEFILLAWIVIFLLSNFLKILMKPNKKKGLDGHRWS